MENKETRIFTAEDNIQAEMILNTLKENSIPAYKQDLGNAGILNLYGRNSSCGEDIYVADVDVERAKDVLEDMGLLGNVEE